jgi:hypothetical protein
MKQLQNLAKALIVFQVKVDTIQKDAKNPFFKSKYASLSNIQEAIREPLIESGLAISQMPNGENGLTTLLIHADSGEFIHSTFQMRPVKDDPQGRGSCITYQKRYALAAILCLNIDDDDDGNAASYGNGNGVRNEMITDSKLWLNKDSEMFLKAKAKLAAGDTTLEKIRASFKVSKEVEQLLTSKS